MKIHLGILCILGLNFIYFFFKGWKQKITINKNDKWLFIFTLYLILSIILNKESNGFLLIYFFIALNIYFFIRKNFHLIDEKTLFRFQYVIIITGLIQFSLFLFFDYQLNFLGTDHYEKLGSVPKRLRGFFVEPNWYAIAITFNTFFLIKNNIVGFIKKHPIVFFLTGIVLLLNGTFGTLIILIAIYGYKYLKRNLIIGIGVFLIGLLIGNIILNKRAESKKGRKGIELFNHYSRVEPLKRVYNYMEERPVYIALFGEGFGTWGTIAVKHRLSVLNYTINPNSRDGSELPVYFFELGIIGTLIFFLDIFHLQRINSRKDFYLTGALLLFIISFLLYPIFKFLMYMIYYFVLRQVIINNRKERLVLNKQ
ncbi:hypothetical protein [Aquimarina rhabdastrellae]